MPASEQVQIVAFLIAIITAIAVGVAAESVWIGLATFGGLSLVDYWVKG